MYCDNISAVYLTGNLVQHHRTKHVEMDIHFVREKVAKGEVRVLHVPSRHQMAGIFTKGLPSVLFDDFRDSLNVRPPNLSTTGVNYIIFPPLLHIRDLLLREERLLLPPFIQEPAFCFRRSSPLPPFVAADAVRLRRKMGKRNREFSVMNTEGDASKRTTKMEFGMRIARHCILTEINKGGQKNFVMSPLLLHIDLNMLASTSTGQTLQQLLHFLESESITDLNDQSSLFMELANSDDRGPIISFVNGIWVNNCYSLKPSFKRLAEDVYNAKTQSVDFLKQGDQVRNDINSWAKEATRGHIDPFLPKDFFTGNAIALVASAVYFKGAWALIQRFHPSDTEDEDFHLLNGQTVRVPFMKKYFTRDYLYGSFESFKLLKMEYQKSELDDKKYAMYMFLPHQKDGLKELVQKFRDDPRSFLENRKVERIMLDKLWVPKLKYEYELSVTETMIELGLNLPFDEKKAEITEMVETDEVIYVSKAIQKCYIEVNEKGTVAAAVHLRVSGGGMSNKTFPIFVADHPFLFMIKEEVSGIILFVGAALNPSSLDN
ncbi:serpin-Z7-like [Euphorbia lathyris]|uniref:serpin-Z7-like n=1 Tax=Euphorbia lathyris TaxID=212925 RepID=UPI00331395A2